MSALFYVLLGDDDGGDLTADRLESKEQEFRSVEKKHDEHVCLLRRQSDQQLLQHRQQHRATVSKVTNLISVLTFKCVQLFFPNLILSHLNSSR